ncbi:NADP-dependent malic enzyme [Klebsiella pneumoniae subsp. rhinoscleromatis]|nr:NADP-dependent malic enzyme [Klebsiella pneumoniae subsp. rhinoscleromatis]
MFDIEVDELDPDKFINVVAALEPTFGGINLEDIKAPECFYIEQQLRERMNIPVFHDDQHGTAIISTAAILNGLRVVEKNLSDVRMVVSGAGAAAIACMNLLVALGMQKHNIVVCDSKGVIYKDREPNMAETKAAYAVEDDGKRTLDDVIDGADIFLGCSGPKVLTQEMVKKMARAPLILALANRSRKFCRRWRNRSAMTPSSVPAAPTTLTRSTTYFASRSSSAARWTSARRRSTKR